MGTERLTPAPMDGNDHAASLEVKDHKCTGAGDMGSNMGGTGSASLAFPVDDRRKCKAEE